MNCSKMSPGPVVSISAVRRARSHRLRTRERRGVSPSAWLPPMSRRRSREALQPSSGPAMEGHSPPRHRRRQQPPTPLFYALPVLPMTQHPIRQLKDRSKCLTTNYGTCWCTINSMARGAKRRPSWAARARQKHRHWPSKSPHQCPPILDICGGHNVRATRESSGCVHYQLARRAITLARCSMRSRRGDGNPTPRDNACRMNLMTMR